MAAVIHSLWEKGHRNPLILPSTVPIDDARVQSELTRYLSDNWAPIIEKDVDGSNSLPLKIDAEQPNLGKLHATQRVARTIYLGSAPNRTIPGMVATDGKLALQVRGPIVDEIARIEQIIVDKSAQAIQDVCSVLAVSLNSFTGDMAALDARIAQALAGSAARFHTVARFHTSLADTSQRTASALIYGTEAGRLAVPDWLHAALNNRTYDEPTP